MTSKPKSSPSWLPRFLLGLASLLTGLFFLFSGQPASVHGQEPVTEVPIQTALPNGTEILLATETITITETVSVTETATVTATEPPAPQPTATPTPLPPVLFPLVLRQHQQEPVQYLPSQAMLFCNNSPVSIPDNNTGLAASSIASGENRFIGDLDVSLDISHTWVGDLTIQLTQQETGKSITLIDRPGYPSTAKGCSSDDIKTILDDGMNSLAENKCAGSPAAIAGSYVPAQPLSTFNLGRAAGTWVLTITDHDLFETGRLNGWCISAKVSEAPAPATPPPPPPALPAQARVNGISGKDQALPLDCESRSAVDWAGSFGHRIDELRFFNQLPKSDNPDKGFVGDVYGLWGQIPPNAYGIHAEPVAALLRAYGLQAFAHRPLRWEDLQKEIAAGRPVFVWVIGSVYSGIPVYWTPSDGLHTVVARREHTVLVVGYSPTEVTILDGDSFYTRNITAFLDSWSALGNMAITASP